MTTSSLTLKVSSISRSPEVDAGEEDQVDRSKTHRFCSIGRGLIGTNCKAINFRSQEVILDATYTHFVEVEKRW